MSKKNIIILLSCIAILAIAGFAVFLIFSNEPEAKSEGATKKTAMLVSVIEAEEGSFTPEFIATGTVQPVEDVQLNALVSGQVIERSSSFAPGGLVRKGQQLLKINPADFINQVQLRESELLQVQSDLKVEMGRQTIAEQDLALVGIDSLPSEQQSLVLRQPQLDAVRAQIKAAEASLNQAKLNLSRTSVTAPFDAQVISQNVTVGSQVGLADDLGRLVGINEYWVEATIPIERLQWLSFPSTSQGRGSPVKVRNTGSWKGNEFRHGYLSKQIGALEDQTRLARVLIKIPDPLSYQSKNRGAPKLLIGEFLEASIQGKETGNVVRLSRDYLRNNQTVWVMDENDELSIREVEILLMDANYAYITNGIEGGEKIVTTNISTVTEGVSLRTESDTTANEMDSLQQDLEE